MAVYGWREGGRGERVDGGEGAWLAGGEWAWRGVGVYNVLDFRIFHPFPPALRGWRVEFLFVWCERHPF